METLAVQTFLGAGWQDVALIQFPGSEQGGWFITQIDYFTDYAIDSLECDDYHAVPFNHPASLYLEDHGSPGWLRFIDGIIPNGVSRRYWINFLDISELPQGQQNFILLRFGTMSPMGSLHIRDPVPGWDSPASSKMLSITDVMNRANDFLDYNQE